MASSLGAARAFVLDACALWGLDCIAAVASLVVSEIVTNAVLHARSTAELLLRVQPEALEIEVRDGSSQLPQPRELDPLSATGRGLMIVDQLSSSWGAEPLADGKRVWCTLALKPPDLSRPKAVPAAQRGRHAAETSVIQASGHTETALEPEADPFKELGAANPSSPGAGSDGPELMTVRLLQLPVELSQAFSRHHEELLREFALLAISAEQKDASVPRDLLELVGTLSEQYAEFSRQPAMELAAALERGVASVDIKYVVPIDAAHAACALNQQLHAAEEYCRKGELLTLCGSPELRAFRIWFLEEFVRQADGAPPRPFEYVEHFGRVPEAR